MVLYIAIFGVSFLMGLSNMTQGDLFMRVLKIGIIYSLLLPGSWEFFNDFIVSFEQSAEDISMLLAGNFIGEKNGVESSIYSLLDRIIYLLFQPVIHYKATSVFFSPILIGIIMGVALYYAFLLMIYAIGKSIIVYLVIKIIFTMLFMVAPIFIIFLLFEKTKEMFEKWLNMLISYSVQLIFLFLAIAFFSYLILEIFYGLFNFGVCWKPIWIIKLGSFAPFELFSYWRFWGFDARYSEVYNASNGPDFTSILFFLTIAYCFKQIIDKITDLGNAIAGAGGVGAGSLATNMSKDALGAIGKGLGFVGAKIAMPIASRSVFMASYLPRKMLQDANNALNSTSDNPNFLSANKSFLGNVKDGMSAEFRAGVNKFYKNSNLKQAFDGVTKKHNPFYVSPEKNKAQQDAYDKALKETGSVAQAEKARNMYKKTGMARLLRAYDLMGNTTNAIESAYQKSMFHNPSKKIKTSIIDTSNAYHVNVDKLNKLSNKFKKEIKNNKMLVGDAMDQFKRGLVTSGMHQTQLDIYNKRAAREFGEAEIARRKKALDNMESKILKCEQEIDYKKTSFMFSETEKILNLRAKRSELTQEQDLSREKFESLKNALQSTTKRLKNLETQNNDIVDNYDADLFNENLLSALGKQQKLQIEEEKKQEQILIEKDKLKILHEKFKEEQLELKRISNEQKNNDQKIKKEQERSLEEKLQIIMEDSLKDDKEKLAILKEKNDNKNKKEIKNLEEEIAKYDKKALLKEKERQEKELQIIEEEAKERERKYQAIIEANNADSSSVKEQRQQVKEAQNKAQNFKGSDENSLAEKVKTAKEKKSSQTNDLLNSYRNKVASLRNKETALMKKINKANEQDKGGLEAELSQLKSEISNIEGSINSYKASE